jgi:hypothetical protein
MVVWERDVVPKVAADHEVRDDRHSQQSRDQVVECDAKRRPRCKGRGESFRDTVRIGLQVNRGLPGRSVDTSTISETSKAIGTDA